MTKNQERDTLKREIKEKYTGLFNKLVESEQIQTEAVLNFNYGGKWSAISNLNYTEDMQTVNKDILILRK
jgi:hypothetical protein